MNSSQNLLQGINSAQKSPAINLPHYACYVLGPSCVGAQAQDATCYGAGHKISHVKTRLLCVFTTPGFTNIGFGMPNWDPRNVEPQILCLRANTVSI